MENSNPYISQEVQTGLYIILSKSNKSSTIINLEQKKKKEKRKRK